MGEEPSNPNPEPEPTGVQKTLRTVAGLAGLAWLVLAYVFARELVPAWAFLNLGWEPIVYYTIVAILGGVSGFAGDYKLIAIPCFALSSIGSLYLTASFLEQVNMIHRLVVLVIVVVGALPGQLVYSVIWIVLQKLSGNAQSKGAKSGPEDERGA
jgi:hypothetical protein